MEWDELAEHPLVTATRELAGRLTERAAATEHVGVTRAVLDELAAAGLHAVDAVPERGGVEPAVRRRVAELLAGADPQVWFVWFQHGPVVGMLSRSENTALAEATLPGLCAGTTMAGVAFSHLRSPRPSVRAERVDGGWRLAGQQPWCTGWGLLNVVLVGAVTDDEQALFGLVPAVEGAGITSTGELPLAAMGATRTVGLDIDGLLVQDADAVLAMPYADWRTVDIARNANVQPSTFGIALATLDALADRAPELARELRSAVLDVRAQAYRLIDEAPHEEQVNRRLELRARALLLGMQAATALVTSRGGAAFSFDSVGQRLLRAAAHQLVHSQDQPVRAATLDALGALEPLPVA